MDCRKEANAFFKYNFNWIFSHFIEKNRLILEKFWAQHPALLYSLCALFGSSLALFSLPVSITFLFLITLLIPIINTSYLLRLILGLLLGVVSFFLAKERHFFPQISESALNGTAEVEILAVTTARTPFGRSWVYKGKLQSFYKDNENRTMARNIPIRISLPIEKYPQRPLADKTYRLKGRLKKTEHGLYSLHPKSSSWEPIEKKLNLVEWRSQTKESFQKYIKTVIRQPHVAAFLTGIATGELDDLQLAFELGRFGLQHLIAVSGLHFSILASLLSLLLGFFLSKIVSAISVIGILSAYFLFLGASPSVMRAWVAISLALFGLLIKRRSFPLNSLGVALLIQTLMAPLCIQQIAFQYSYGITVSILLWTASCDAWLQKIFCKRSLCQVVDIGLINQHGYCFLVFFRQAAALGIAVNLVALPLTLYHFQQFPLMSLFYNLFFPFMVSFSLLFLLLACLMALINPSISILLHSSNEYYTRFLLNLTFNLPKSFDFVWHTDKFPKDLLLFYLFGIFLTGIIVKGWRRTIRD